MISPRANHDRAQTARALGTVTSPSSWHKSHRRMGVSQCARSLADVLVPLDTQRMHEQLRTRTETSTSVRIAWEILHLLQLNIRSIEDTATRVVAAQVAGLIALWTQLGNFENGPPEVLAWTAWAILVASILALGVVVTPRRVTRFWNRLATSSLLVTKTALDEDDELEMIADLSDALRAQRESLHRMLRVSIALGLVALGVAGFAYVVEKGFYAP